MDFTFNGVENCSILDTCQLRRKLFGVLYGIQRIQITLCSVGKSVGRSERMKRTDMNYKDGLGN